MWPNFSLWQAIPIYEKVLMACWQSFGIYLWIRSLQQFRVSFLRQTLWPDQRACMGRWRIPFPLQKAGAWRFQLAPHKRRGTGDHTGTISGIDEGAGDRLQTSDPGSASSGSPVKHCANGENQKSFHLRRPGQIGSYLHPDLIAFIQLWSTYYCWLRKLLYYLI